MQPAFASTFTLPRSLLPDQVVGSLDRGCSLTKIAYRQKSSEDDDSVTLQLALFANKDFDAALQWLALKLKQEAPPGDMFRVTGVGGEMFRGLVANAVGLRVEFVDEFVGHTAGARLLIDNFPSDKFCFPSDAPQAELQVEAIPDWIAAIIHKNRLYYADSIGRKLPAMFCFAGSGVLFNLLAEGESDLRLLGTSMIGGKTMMGLAKLALGITDYDQLMTMVEAGDRAKLDTQAKEVMDLGEGASFQNIPPDFPLFSLGKIADGAAEDSYSKEDLAASLVALVISHIVSHIITYCKMHKVTQIYVAGNMFKARVAREIFGTFVKSNFAAMGVFEFHFVSVGHTACLGALVKTQEEAEKLRLTAKANG